MNLNQYVLDGTDLDSFVKKYRESLKDTYDTTAQNLDATKNRAETVIMGSSNRAGTMYSNFPQRSKLQYQADTYLPAKASAFSTYSTGLDTLRSNNAELINNIKDLQESIADINKYGVSTTTTDDDDEDD